MNYSVIYFNEIKLALDKRKQQQKRAEKKHMTLSLSEFQSNITYFYYYIESGLLNLPNKHTRKKLTIIWRHSSYDKKVKGLTHF